MNAMGGVLVIVRLPDGGACALPLEQVTEGKIRAQQMGFGSTPAAAPAVAEERWLDSRQLAAVTGIGDTTLEGLARTGVIPSLRAGKALRFKLSEVEKALSARRDL